MSTSTSEITQNPDLYQQLTQEMQSDEEIVWAGQPRPGLASRKGLLMIPFGFLFAGIAGMFVMMAGMSPFGFLGLIGIPFVLVGVALMFTPVFLSQQAKRTLYALTNRRAIIWKPNLFDQRQVYSYLPESLGGMYRSENSDGSGDLIFEEIRSSHYRNGRHRTRITRRGFMGIENVREVEHLVRDTLLNKN